MWELCVGELLIAFLDVAFLSSQASFSTTFLKNCGSGESHGTTTYPRAVVGGKQGHAPCRKLALTKLLCVS